MAGSGSRRGWCVAFAGSCREIVHSVVKVGQRQLASAADGPFGAGGPRSRLVRGRGKSALQRAERRVTPGGP